MGYKSDAQRKAVHASKADGGAGNPNKMKSGFKMKYTDGKKASPAKMFNEINRQTTNIGMQKDPISRKIDEKVEEKVNEVVNNQSEQGLV
jgi:predicted secreted Zn-dependent protease